MQTSIQNSKKPLLDFTQHDESPVRFLHVFPSYGLGGAELRIGRTINRMGPGFNHAILSINGTMDAAQYLEPEIGVRFFMGPPKRSPLLFPGDLWTCIRKLNPHVILTYNWGATDAIIGARLSRFRPIIHNECGLSTDIDGKGWRRRWIRRLLLPWCHRVVVTSFTLRELALRRYGVSSKRLAFIKTGVDTERYFPGNNDDLRKRIAADRESQIFGYVGTLRPSKNLSMLLRAFAAARRDGDRLAIFGEGPDRDALVGLSEQLGIRDEVYFHGHTSHPELAFRAIDVNVTTSKSEAASNSLLEAMATGLAVVSTDIADNRCILSEANHRFVYAHDDFEGFVDGLRTLSLDRDVRLSLGRQNRQRVCEEYPVDRMYREYAELWESAARAARGE